MKQVALVVSGGGAVAVGNSEVTGTRLAAIIAFAKKTAWTARGGVSGRARIREGGGGTAVKGRARARDRGQRGSAEGVPGGGSSGVRVWFGGVGLSLHLSSRGSGDGRGVSGRAVEVLVLSLVNVVSELFL